MISFDEIDLMGWNSPSNNNATTKTINNLAKPLLPTVNIQSPSIVNNPFDAICDKIDNQNQNPFDDICSLVEMQTTAKQCKNEENEVNLLNMTIIATSKEDLLSISNPEVNTSTRSDVSDILNVSSLDDNLLPTTSPDDKVTKEMQGMTLLDRCRDEQKMRENNNCLSQSQCDFSLANTSMNDSFYEHGQRYHELCSRLDSSFNKSKTLYDEIVTHDQKALAAFKRRSAEFSKMQEREDEKAVIEKKALSTSQTICSKTALKPLDSPDLKLRACSSLKNLPSSNMTRDTVRRPSRQGPMKAIAPLKSMVKSSNVLTDKLDLKDPEKPQVAPLFKSSYHKSPVKQLNLRSRSAGSTPRLTSSTPEKSSSAATASAFSSPSPLKSLRHAPDPSNLTYATSPLKSIRSTSPFKSIRAVQTDSAAIPTTPLRTETGSQNSVRTETVSQHSVRTETGSQHSVRTETGSQHSVRNITSPLRSVGSTYRKSIRSPSPMKSVATSPINCTEPSPLKSVATSPLKSTAKSLKSVSASQLKFPRASPLKSSSANVGGGNIPGGHSLGGHSLGGHSLGGHSLRGHTQGGFVVPEAGLKPRSSSLSRLKPPKSFASKANRFNSSHDEKENIAVQFVL